MLRWIDLGSVAADIQKVVDEVSSQLKPGNHIVVRGQIETDLARPAAARTDLIRAIATYERAFKGPHYKTGAAEVYLALAESKLDQTDAALHAFGKLAHNPRPHLIQADHFQKLARPLPDVRFRQHGEGTVIFQQPGRTQVARKSGIFVHVTDAGQSIAIAERPLKPAAAT